MGISFGSINTGLPPDIVQQLVNAERLPIKNLEGKKAKVQEQLKLVDDLTQKVRDIFGGIKELGNTRGFADLKLETGDQNILGGTVDKNIATSGSYQIEVQKLAHKTSAVSNGFPDKNETQVGVGYFKIKDSEGNTREIYVDNKNNTLEKLANLINSKDIGIRASVIKDPADKETPYKMLLSGKGIGEDGGVGFPTFYFLDGDQDFFLDKERPAENGHVKVDGVDFDIAENKLKDVIPGVTLDLRQAAPGKEINVTVAEDREVIVGKVKKFVDQINGVLSFIQTQNAVGKDTDTTKTLGGDSTLRGIESRLRSVLQNPVFGAQGEIKYLNQLGIAFNRSGLLEFDEAKFNGVVSKQLGDVTQFLIGDNDTYGLVPQLKVAINQMLDGVTGPLPQRSRGFKTKIEQFDQQIANKERLLAKREEQLKAQFGRLEETMAKLKSQGSYLSAHLGTGGDGGSQLHQS